MRCVDEWNKNRNKIVDLHVSKLSNVGGMKQMTSMVACSSIFLPLELLKLLVLECIVGICIVDNLNLNFISLIFLTCLKPFQDAFIK